MIHRFVDLPSAPAASPLFLYKLHHEETSGANPYETWWLGGNLATPERVSSTIWSESSSGLFNRGITTQARLSRDRSKVVYNWGHPTNASAPRIKIGTVPGAGSGLAATDIAVATSTTTSIGFACWNGDDTKVVYARSVLTGGILYAQIRIVDEDGTNDTLLYSRGGSLAGEFIYVNIESLLVNHAGTKIAWVDQSQSVGGFTNAGVWVMDIDGSSPTKIVDWSSENFTTSDHLIGFSHDDTYLGFTQTYDDGSGTKVHFKKVTMAGTVTDMFASASYFRQQYDYQWLPDDSGILAVHANVYGSQPRSVIEVIDAGGGGATALSPERRIDTSGSITSPQNYPVVCDADNRIYWYDLASTSVVSVAADGSDFRTDHTLDGTSTVTTNDQQFRTLFTGS